MVNNTEKNEQEQTIHYPFGGFYRKLLPTAETSTTAPQTAQEAPIYQPRRMMRYIPPQRSQSAPLDGWPM